MNTHLFQNIYDNQENASVNDYKNFFKSIKSSHTFKNKQAYVEKFNLFANTYQNFPWRTDQINAIDSIASSVYKYTAIQGVFGAGKTTMLFGLVIKLITSHIYMPEDIMFISFNVCIKNELKQKLKPFGFKGKVRVSTFDSIVYHICKRLDYPHLDLPNFDGKRRFLYDACLEGVAKPQENQPKLILIDETQDLDGNCYFFFKYFYPESRIVFAGDIFQSIQKEPRESLLWFLLNSPDNIGKYFMYVTPRVPPLILESLKNTLSSYYPEFVHEIAMWESSNTVAPESKIIWRRFNTYKDIYKESRAKIDEYGEENTMILMFSGAITVKGNIGDISRMRKELSSDYDVNKNHKKLEYDKLFLSTANSSKGLERDHVVIFSTFPLELAFSNFSNDIVLNLISVALSRAIKTVEIYVPSYEDKFSPTLGYFEGCLFPNKERIREGKKQSELTFSDYINIERSVTELIRQSILVYDTRIKIKKNIKPFHFEKCFEGEISCKRPVMLTEEDRAFVGLIIENLITSTWSGRWPQILGISELKNNPMYCHIFHKLEVAHRKYASYLGSNIFENHTQFRGVVTYTELHLAIYNKIFINFPKEILDRIENYWNHLKPKVNQFKPVANKFDIQSNVRMKLLTGIADCIFTQEKNLNVCEIKASAEMEYRDDALTQAMLYSLCTGQRYNSITLINPFRNDKITYRFDAKHIITLRELVYHDVLVWNFNCYLAKKYNTRNKRTLRVSDKYFAYVNYHENVCETCGVQTNCKKSKTGAYFCKTCCEIEQEDEKLWVEDEVDSPIQLTIVEFLSPTKIHIRVNKYYKSDQKIDGVLGKLCSESEDDYCDKWLGTQKKPVWIISKKIKDCNHISELASPIDNDYETAIDYEPSDTHSLNFKCGLVKTLVNLKNLSEIYKFI